MQTAARYLNILVLMDHFVPILTKKGFFTKENGKLRLICPFHPFGEPKEFYTGGTYSQHLRLDHHGSDDTTISMGHMAARVSHFHKSSPYVQI